MGQNQGFIRRGFVSKIEPDSRMPQLLEAGNFDKEASTLPSIYSLAHLTAQDGPQHDLPSHGMGECLISQTWRRSIVEGNSS
jgi:hypothetical protein